METVQELAKRYEAINPHWTESPPTGIRHMFVNVMGGGRRPYQRVQPYPKPIITRKAEEPIDLTQGLSRPLKVESSGSVPNYESNAEHLLQPHKSNQSKLYFQNGVNFKDVIKLQTTETKQVEILKAAKSLFSKRTRTLYHWMYPNTPKPHIKLAVANSWDNLGTQEKQFYISQVLVRFGFPQCNLMVNPQLGGIKELPPLPDTLETNYLSSELQNAVSSISGGPSMKRKQGRPLGSKNKKGPKNGKNPKMAKDFQDDPELSKELEKFSVSFDCFK